MVARCIYLLVFGVCLYFVCPFIVLVGYYGSTSWYNIHVSDCANRYMRVWSLDPFCHFLVGIRNFTAHEPFKSAATPFWWGRGVCEPIAFFRSPALLFGATNRRFGLLAFLFHSHSFLVMLKVCAFLRLVSWLLSFDHVIPRGSKTMQPKLMLSSSISETYRGRVLFRWLTL